MSQVKIVKVRWNDTASHSAWTDHRDAIQDDVLMVETVGYLLHKNQKRILLARSLAENDDDDGVFAIPKGCIVSMTDLGSGNRPERLKKGK